MKGSSEDYSCDANMSDPGMGGVGEMASRQAQWSYPYYLRLEVGKLAV